MGDQTKVVRDTTTYYLLSRNEIVALSSDLGAFSIVGLTIPALNDQEKTILLLRRPLEHYQATYANKKSST